MIQFEHSTCLIAGRSWTRMVEEARQWVLARWSEWSALKMLTRASRQILTRAGDVMSVICSMGSAGLPLAALAGVLLGAIVTSIRSIRQRRTRCRVLPSDDRTCDLGREPPLGAHVVTPRRGYTHHGIYVGEGKVVHYGGLSWGLRPGRVEEVPFSQFSRGRPVWVRITEAPWFDQHEVIRRARLRLGEDRYSVLTNNCEHFCEWCVRGLHRSYQVDHRMMGYRGVLLGLIERLARVPPRPYR